MYMSKLTRLSKPLLTIISVTLFGAACTVPASTRTMDTIPSVPSSVVTDQSSTVTTILASTEQSADSLVWSSCDSGSFCATKQVPYSYEIDTGKYFTLSLKMLRASEETSKGYLLINPGGPGFGGTSMIDYIDYYLSDKLISNFDIVAWDPRGTGKSVPAVNCVDSFDPYFALDMTPDTPAAKKKIVDVSKDFNARCVEKSGDILQYVSTRNSAQDIDSIRSALGVEQISYFGFSYGSELGATWATLFPETVRAAVLDGASDPTSSVITKSLAQASGFEMQLNKFLKYCADRSLCPFNNGLKPDVALDDLLHVSETKPVIAERTPITNGVIYVAISNAMYSSKLWDTLAQALYDLQIGDGSGILSLYDSYFQYDATLNTYGNELEAFIAISCLDENGPESVKLVDSYFADFLKAAPRLGPLFAYGYFCALWPHASQPRTVITGANAGPIVVIGTTGDAATPIESSSVMAASLEEGILLIVEAEQHTGYNVNKCINKAVDAYLVDLVKPLSGLTC